MWQRSKGLPGQQVMPRTIFFCTRVQIEGIPSKETRLSEEGGAKYKLHRDDIRPVLSTWLDSEVVHSISTLQQGRI